MVFGLLERGLRREPIWDGDLRRVAEIGRLWPDQDFTPTDRLAFACIERIGIPRAWSYDSDFAVIRLGIAKAAALELIT